MAPTGKDPNCVGTPVLMPSNLFDLTGELSGGLLRVASSLNAVFWELSDPSNAPAATLQYRVFPRIMPLGVLYTLTIPAFDQMPEVEIEFLHSDPVAELQTKLESLGQVVSCTVTGGPFYEAKTLITVEWISDTMQFKQIAISGHDLPVPDKPFFWKRGERVEVYDKDTLQIIAGRQLINTGSAIGTVTASAAYPLGNGDLLTLEKSGTNDPYLFKVYSGDDITATPIATHTAPNPNPGSASQLRYGVQSAYNNLLMQRRTNSGHPVGFSAVGFDLDFTEEVVMDGPFGPGPYGGGWKHYTSTELAGTNNKSMVVSALDNEGSGYRNNGASGTGYYTYLDVDDSNYASNVLPYHIRKYAPFVSINQNDFIGMNGAAGGGDELRTYTSRTPANIYNPASTKGSQTVFRIDRDGNGTQDLFPYPYSEVQFVCYTPLGSRYNPTCEWRIFLTGYSAAYQYYDRPVESATDWLPFDANMTQVQAALTYTFGEHVNGFSETKPNVTLDHLYSGDGTNSRIAHDFMLWQDAMQVRAYGVGANYNEEGGLAGVIGHYWQPKFDTLTLAEKANLWTKGILNEQVYLNIQVRDSNYPAAPAPFTTEPMSAMRWSDGEIEWQRNFGESVVSGLDVKPDKLMIAYQGTTVVGLLTTDQVEEEL